jgi:hypothetical protein
MSALPLRRALLLIVPIALVLAGCDGGEGKPGIPSGLGDTNPAAGEPPEPATGLPPVHRGSGRRGNDLRRFDLCWLWFRVHY